LRGLTRDVAAMTHEDQPDATPEDGLVGALIAAMPASANDRLPHEREIACGGVGAIHACSRSSRS